MERLRFVVYCFVFVRLPASLQNCPSLFLGSAKGLGLPKCTVLVDFLVMSHKNSTVYGGVGANSNGRNGFDDRPLDY